MVLLLVSEVQLGQHQLTCRLFCLLMAAMSRSGFLYGHALHRLPVLLAATYLGWTAGRQG